VKRFAQTSGRGVLRALLVVTGGLALVAVLGVVGVAAVVLAARAGVGDGFSMLVLQLLVSASLVAGVVTSRRGRNALVFPGRAVGRFPGQLGSGVSATGERA